MLPLPWCIFFSGWIQCNALWRISNSSSKKNYAHTKSLIGPFSHWTLIAFSTLLRRILGLKIGTAISVYWLATFVLGFFCDSHTSWTGMGSILIMWTEQQTLLVWNQALLLLQCRLPYEKEKKVEGRVVQSVFCLGQGRHKDPVSPCAIATLKKSVCLSRLLTMYVVVVWIIEGSATYAVLLYTERKLNKVSIWTHHQTVKWTRRRTCWQHFTWMLFLLLKTNCVFFKQRPCCC